MYRTIFCLLLILNNIIVPSLSGQEVYTVVEVMPEYPGGDEAMIDFLKKNVVYPEEAKKNNIEGVVYVSFVVSEEGEIREVRLLRAPHHLLGNEAVRVVKSMPRWTPGKQGGERVSVQYNLPIKFSLSGKKGKKK